MIFVKTLLYMVKLMVRKTQVPTIKDILVCIGVISGIGFICLLIGRKTAK